MRRPSDLQIYYQRNSLIAILIVVGCSLLFSLYLFTLSSQESDIPNILSTTPRTIDTGELSNSIGKTDSVRAIKNVKIFNPYANSHHGFIGFVDLKITTELPVKLEIPQPVFTLTSTEASFDNLPSSFSILDGTDTGFYVSDYGDAELSFAIGKNSGHNFSREIEVLRQVNPEYPWVAKESSKEGVISVLVYIDSVGNISKFPNWIEGDGVKTLVYQINGEKKMGEYVAIEEPEGWFFAKNFIDVLPKWRFSPRIKNGKPISSLLRIKYTFCLWANCARYEIELITSPSSNSFMKN